jgi:hypothetical protein
VPLDLRIAGEPLRVHSTPAVIEALRRRYALFESGDIASAPPDPIELHVSPARRFDPRYEKPVVLSTRLTGAGEIVFAGPVGGVYSPDGRRGTMRDVVGVGAVDALIRAALSLSVPLAGALLLHGAGLALRGGGLALCGASGSGKSTAAEAFGGFSDELIVLRPVGERGLEIDSTPYWRGRPFRASCEEIVCLQRGEPAGRERLRGSEILRALAPHVVRYVALERVDRAQLGILGKIAQRAAVIRLCCPDGEEYLPFLEANLGMRREVA